MGSAIARNLAAAGNTVVAWNRSGAQIDGARMVAIPAHALRADVALTMLADDQAIRSVCQEPFVFGEAFDYVRKSECL